METYKNFLTDFDNRIAKYFEKHSEHICCKIRCSDCCEKGDYPITELELKFLMQGYSKLDNESKVLIQNNIKIMKKGGKCPFLINKMCSVYSHRPIICRVHGLAYIYKENMVKVPFCVNNKKNYNNVYKKGEFFFEPIKENLETQYILKDFDTGECRNLYDWINIS